MQPHTASFSPASAHHAPRPLTLITGSSRGLGEALAAECLRAGHMVIGIARRHSAALDALATHLSAPLFQWRHDLADPQAAGWALREWLQAQAPTRFASASLINNAGLLAPPGAVAESDPADLARVLRVGLEAPVLLTQQFLAGTAGWPGPRRVLNISSGLGRRAAAGNAAYSAAKAGLDHFTRVVALEEAARPHGARLVSLAPGVIDTDMQVQLRGSDPARFGDQPLFAALHAEGRLVSATDTALRVLAWLARPDFGQVPVADVRNPGPAVASAT
jgi:benzil reductase ((S)-benzoin forming)